MAQDLERILRHCDVLQNLKPQHRYEQRAYEEEKQEVKQVGVSKINLKIITNRRKRVARITGLPLGGRHRHTFAGHSQKSCGWNCELESLPSRHQVSVKVRKLHFLAKSLNDFKIQSYLLPTALGSAVTLFHALRESYLRNDGHLLPNPMMQILSSS